MIDAWWLVQILGWAGRAPPSSPPPSVVTGIDDHDLAAVVVIARHNVVSNYPTIH